MDRMYEIGKKYGTDKIGQHKYHEIYPTFIEKFYNMEGGMLEVGLLGGASLKMWLELFPKMHIYGIDLDPNESIEKHERHTILQADQSSISQLQDARQKIEHPLWFINDDGSHIPEHQLLTFNELFPKLEVGGVYIIEDVETSYWTRGGLYGYETRYGLGHPKSIIEIFKEAVDGVNYEYCRNEIGPVKHQKEFQSVTFGKNCIIIVKREPETREYIYKKLT